jgi:hypothetical protein
MGILAVLGGVVLIFLMLLDTFEAIVQPRRVTRPFRFARFFYRNGWALWGRAARGLSPGKVRETFLSVFGPLSVLALIASWVVSLIAGFALVHWGLQTPLAAADPRAPGLGTYLYMSGQTFFTLGFGDTTAASPVGRVLTVVEAGMGFGFLALVIGYLPVLYQAFSRREVTISLLDARAGSPPSAGEALLRAARSRHVAALDPFLAEWERWAAELLESHLSFPLLSYYRSQHDNQSWLAALTVVLDTCALLIAGVRDGITYQAQLTFAVARHAAVDLAMIFQTRPVAPTADRFSEERRCKLWAALREAGLEVSDGPAVGGKLAELRAMYEPFVQALATYFLFPLPPLLRDQQDVDNWQTSAWMRRTVGIDRLAQLGGDDHFD